MSHYPAKFGSQRHCGSAYMMFVVIEGQDFACPHLDPPLLFISKAHVMLCSHARNFKTKTQ